MTHQLILDCETAQRRLNAAGVDSPTANGQRLVRRSLGEGGLTASSDPTLSEHLEMCPDCGPLAATLIPTKFHLPLTANGQRLVRRSLGEGGLTASFELSSEFRASLHSGIMQHVQTRSVEYPEKRAHAVRPYVSLATGHWSLTTGLAASVIFVIFAIAFSVFLWNTEPVETASFAIPETAPVAPAPFNGAVVAEPFAIPVAASPRRGEQTSPAAANVGRNIPHSAFVIPHLEDAVPVRVRYDGSETVLEWGFDGRFRVLRSETPDFASARYVEWIEVEGTSYRDTDPKPPASGVRFYRVERIQG